MLTIPSSDSRFIDAWLKFSKQIADDMIVSQLKKEPTSPIPVNFHLSSSGIVNALAKIESDKNGNALNYLIQLNEGLVRAIGEHIAALMSRPDIIPELGNVKKTKDAVVLSTDRAKVLFDMLSVSMYFVILHELGHMRFGHLDWYSNKFNCLSLQEKEHIDISDPITSQAIELLADVYALAISSSTYFENELSAKCAGFGLGVVFELLSHQSYDFSEYKESSHPHPLVRAINTIVIWHEGTKNQIPEKLVKSWLSGLMESIAGHSSIRKETIFEGPWQEAFSEMIKLNVKMDMDEIWNQSARIGMEHYLCIEKRSNDLTEELHPYRWDNL
jgi:hypothetical protein